MVRAGLEPVTSAFHVRRPNHSAMLPPFSQWAKCCGLTTGSIFFFRNKFPGLFQDSKIHINPFTPKISMLILLTVCHIFHIFYLSLTDFQTFPEPVAFFPGLSSPGKCYNKILGLSRFSRTRTNPVTRRSRVSSQQI